MLEQLFPNVKWEMMIEATIETLYMTAISVVATFFLGIILRVNFIFNKLKGIYGKIKSINGIISAFVNIFRSIPFIILIVLLIPFTKVLVGTMIGENAALPALIIGSAPFYARMVEMGLREIDKGVIEAAKSMGAKTSTIIWKVLIPESTTSACIRDYRYIDCLSWLYSDGRSYWSRRARKSSLFRRISTQSE